MLNAVRRTPWVLVAALAMSAAACGDQIAAPEATPGPVRMIILAGDAQTARPGRELPQPVVVRVVDQAGDPVPNQIVNFRVVSGGGSVYAGAGLTNAQGIAQERWTLGPRDNERQQRLEVRAVSSDTGEKQLFGTFTAFSLDSVAIVASSAVSADSTRLRFFWYAPVAEPSTFEWDTGDDAGTFRKSGTTTKGILEVVYPNNPPRNYWFCYRGVNNAGQRSTWECTYFGAPFRTS
jgi:hypothetical protein